MEITDLSSDERYLLSFIRGASPELRDTISRAFAALAAQNKQNIQQVDIPPFTLIQGSKS